MNCLQRSLNFHVIYTFASSFKKKVTAGIMLRRNVFLEALNQNVYRITVLQQDDWLSWKLLITLDITTQFAFIRHWGIDLQ